MKRNSLKNFVYTKLMNRNHSRLKTDISGMYRKKNGDEFIKCKIINLSISGAGVEMKAFVLKDEEIEVKFILSGAELQLQCRVVYMLGKIVGLNFQNI